MSREVPIDRITHIQSVTTPKYASSFVGDLTPAHSPVTADRPYVLMYLRERTDLLIVVTLIFRESAYDQEAVTRESYRYILDTFPVTDALRDRMERVMDS